MLTSSFQIAHAIHNPRFQMGDDVVLVAGTNKYTRGKFLRLNNDTEWAAIEDGKGNISSHPIEWMRSYPIRK